MADTSCPETTSECIARFAHDMRNPLSAILNSAEIIKMQEDLSEESIGLADTIIERVRAAAALLQELQQGFAKSE